MLRIPGLIRRKGDSDLEQTSAQRDRNGMGAIVRLQLIDDILDVKVDRRFGDGELIRDLFILVSFTNQFKNLELSGREIFLPHVLGDTAGDVGRNMLSTCRYRTDDAQDFIFGGAFQHVGSGARA